MSDQFKSMLERYVQASAADEGGEFKIRHNMIDYALELKYSYLGKEVSHSIPFGADPTYSVDQLVELGRQLRKKILNELAQDGVVIPAEPCSFGGCI